ncbi:SGNH/GDSL hydrolase family protein [Peribacillus sp. SCS-26]|uniref:SGNH/GDSL hydrolase family protein n=1 Tax=Paraperibacillus marinus TaxID=3115295 RepID=UPI0039061229
MKKGWTRLNKLSVSVLSIAALLLLCLYLGGFVYAVNNNVNGQPQQDASLLKKESQEKEDGKEISVAAIGDSLTRGIGDESGKGYIGYLTDEMKEKTKKKVVVQNLGISGQRSNQLLAQIKTKSIKERLAEADYVLITIGGNDLFQGGQTLADFNQEKIKEIQQKYIQNIKAIFSGIRKENPEAVIFLAGLYNPFSEMDNGKETSAVVREWNFSTAETAAGFNKTVFVPTFDLFELQVNDLLYTDRFHPNTKGYRLIAERVAALLTL